MAAHKLVFIGCVGDPSEDEACVVHGVSFPLGEPVSVTDDLFALLSTNPAFRVADVSAPRVAKPVKE